MAGLLFSCGEEEAGLSVAMAQEPPSFDVMVNTSISGREILVGNVFERPLAYEDGEIIPLIAESYSFEDEGCTLRLEIKDGILFHDGSLLTAADVVSSLNRWLSYSDAAEKIVRESWFREDDGDAVISSQSSLSLLPVLIASSSESAVIYKASEIPSDGNIVTSRIGTGPYKVIDYSLGEKLSLELFDGYHGERPSIERLDYYFVSDPVTRRLGLESGTYDFIDTISSDDIPELSSKVFTLNYAEDLEGQLAASPYAGSMLEEGGMDLAALGSYFEKCNEMASSGEQLFNLKELWERYKEGSQAIDDLKAAMTVEKTEKKDILEMLI